IQKENLEKREDRGKQGIKEARSAVYSVHEHRTDVDDAVFRRVIALQNFYIQCKKLDNSYYNIDFGSGI
ncbi:hypothetical protein, partial [Ureibacillus galli]|uniref:hypothetical protein n=1 Tax=Ureibacillus galli TaxID=2762222 RepID=UPI001CD81E5E